VVADTKPADHQTSTLRNTYFFFFAAFFFAFFFVAMVHSFRLWLRKTGTYAPGATLRGSSRHEAGSRQLTRKPVRSARITAPPGQARLRRMNEMGSRREREAGGAGSNFLSPDFVALLVVFRNRTKFRFASLRAVVP
jgi:hypothetical protein